MKYAILLTTASFASSSVAESLNLFDLCERLPVGEPIIFKVYRIERLPDGCRIDRVRKDGTPETTRPADREGAR